MTSQLMPRFDIGNFILTWARLRNLTVDARARPPTPADLRRCASRVFPSSAVGEELLVRQAMTWDLERQLLFVGFSSQLLRKTVQRHLRLLDARVKGELSHHELVRVLFFLDQPELEPITDAEDPYPF
jgi:hypothetical protein